MRIGRADGTPSRRVLLAPLVAEVGDMMANGTVQMREVGTQVDLWPSGDQAKVAQIYPTYLQHRRPSSAHPLTLLVLPQ